MRPPGVIARSALAAFGIVASACSSPASACDDPRAKSGFNELRVSCTPSGSDAYCSATAVNNNLYRCGVTSQDVTALAVFTTSDPSIARFGAAGTGQLMAVGTGTVTVSATYQNLTMYSNPYMFFSPGMPSENLVDLIVSVRNAVTLAKIGGVSVTVTPDKGLAQTGETNQLGVFRLKLRHGVYIISATASGYQPGQSTFGSGTTSISLTTTLDLIPKTP
jgi:hypothetical protein